MFNFVVCHRLNKSQKSSRTSLYRDSSFLIICPEILATSDCVSYFDFCLSSYSALCLGSASSCCHPECDLQQNAGASVYSFVVPPSFDDHSSAESIIQCLIGLISHTFTCFIDFYIFGTR